VHLEALRQRDELIPREDLAGVEGIGEVPASASDAHEEVPRKADAFDGQADAATDRHHHDRAHANA
jgi:hypothetical protein